ncbi:hypothetical protein F511_16530 [Dorcoceras hygrometricum]|uniref:Uncharacterized protein n=1 Tax=Dorcoceras hygrometricum TaxID=472368 RepID=A0A2Z7BAB0_9LAMI|nr:hypothetical protein F511_16530 [Dorcoceras hygrometricum]
MRIRPPELETSICDAKYHVSLWLPSLRLYMIGVYFDPFADSHGIIRRWDWETSVVVEEARRKLNCTVVPEWSNAIIGVVINGVVVSEYHRAVMADGPEYHGPMISIGCLAAPGSDYFSNGNSTSLVAPNQVHDRFPIPSLECTRIPTNISRAEPPHGDDRNEVRRQRHDGGGRRRGGDGREEGEEERFLDLCCTGLRCSNCSSEECRYGCELVLQPWIEHG